jgi:signal transduction histidine kinase
VLRRFLASSTGRFTLLHLWISTAVAAAVFLGFALTAERLLEADVREIVQADIAAIAEAHAERGVEGAKRTLDDFAGPVADPRIVGRLEDAKGDRLSGNLGAWPPTVPTDGRFHALLLYREGRADPATFGMRAMRLPDGSRLLVGRELDERQALAAALARGLAMALGVMVLATLVAGALHARFVFGRLDEVAGVLQKAAAGGGEVRLPIEGGSNEFDRIAIEVNRLLDAQARHRDDMRTITDSLAHDIRGPLFRIRQAAEAAAKGDGARGALQRIEREASQLLAMSTALLETARAHSGMARAQFAAVDVGAMVADIAELFEPVAADAGRALTATIEPDLVLQGHPQLLPQALSNLVENALRHGEGPIRLDARRQGPWIRVSVSDSGPGIAPADRALALEPFTRLDPSRSGPGSGVGLGLVDAIAKLHGGTLELGDNGDAAGLCAILRLAAG